MQVVKILLSSRYKEGPPRELCSLFYREGCEDFGAAVRGIVLEQDHALARTQPPRIVGNLRCGASVSGDDVPRVGVSGPGFPVLVRPLAALPTVLSSAGIA